MSPEDIKTRAQAFNWYHEIELTPGFLTPSTFAQYARPQWEQIRKYRALLDYKDKAVLDLGTMDGMWAFEAEKLGAKTICAIDIWQNAPQGRERCLFAKRVLNSNVNVRKANVHTLAQYVKEASWSPFDIIQCLGLLYHLQNPILALHNIAACLAPDGRVLIETAVYPSPSKDPWCRFNSDEGVYNDPTTYWCPNWACLCAILECAGLTVIHGSGGAILDRINRACFVAKRNDKPLSPTLGLE